MDILAYLSNLRDLRNVLDIVLVATLIFVVLRLFQGTQAVQLIRGVLIIALIALIASQTFDLIAFNWILSALSPAILVALPVIFQPELRRALERIGRTAPLFVRRGDGAVAQRLVNDIARAAEQLSRRKTGALIVFEGQTGLGEMIDRGVRVNAEISAELLQTIFFPNTPLHDGAVIIRGDQIMAAGCVLPLAQADLGDSQLGTRHRAGIGVTEQTDAMSLIVSEETGNISIARNGRIVRVDGGTLRRILTEFYRPGAEVENAKRDEPRKDEPRKDEPRSNSAASAAAVSDKTLPDKSSGDRPPGDRQSNDKSVTEKSIPEKSTPEKSLPEKQTPDKQEPEKGSKRKVVAS